MKTFISLVFALVFFTQTVNSQFYLGLSAGLNVSGSELENIGIESVKSRNDFFFSARPQLYIGENFSILIDVQYSPKGYKYEGSAGQPIENRYTYFDLMPGVQIDVLPFLGIGVGIQYGILIDEQFRINGEDWQDGSLETIKSSDLGYWGMATAQFGGLFGYLRYNGGLSDIVNLQYTDVNGNPIDANQMNRNFQVGAGFRFRFGG